MLAQLVGGLHLVEGDEPLDDLASVLKVLVGDAVNRLDDVRQKGVQLVLGEEAELYGVEEGDELLRRLEDEDAARVVCRGGGWSGGGGGCIDGCGGHADADALGGTGSFELYMCQIELLLRLRERRTSHLALNSSRPWNSLAMVSSASSALYCLSDRSQISV